MGGECVCGACVLCVPVCIHALACSNQHVQDLHDRFRAKSIEQLPEATFHMQLMMPNEERKIKQFYSCDSRQDPVATSNHM